MSMSVSHFKKSRVVSDCRLCVRCQSSSQQQDGVRPQPGPQAAQFTVPSQASQQVGLPVQIGPFRGRLKRVTGGHHI